MTLLFQEPFDNISAWTLSGSIGNWSFPAGRTGNCAQNVSSGDFISRPFGTDGADATLGFAFQVSALWDDRPLVSFWGDGINVSLHITVSSMANGSLKVLRGGNFGTVLGTSAAGIITPNTWYLLELGATLSDTVGRAEVRVNGTAVIGPLTGIDTKNGGTKTVFDTVSLHCFVGGTVTKFDDLYLRNDTTFGTAAPAERSWWPDDYKDPAFQVQRQQVGAVLGGDYVRGSATPTAVQPQLLPNTALRYPSSADAAAVAAVGTRSILHVAPINRSTVEINWGWPAAPNDTWTEVSLVRSAFGRPSTPNDGQTLYRRPQTAFVNPEYPSANGKAKPLIEPPVLQDGSLPPGRWYHYALFFNMGHGEWIRGMVDSCLLPRDLLHAEHLWENVPPYYRWVDSQFAQQQGFLQQFLTVFGFELDQTREFIESWQHLYDIDWSPIRLLRHLGPNFGIEYEAGLGDIRFRALMANIGHLYKIRGTQPGLEMLVENMSKYQCAVSAGSSLLLRPDDSDFYQSTGSWAGLHPDTPVGTPMLAPQKVFLDKTTPGEVTPSKGRGAMRVWTAAADAAAQLVVTVGDGIRYPSNDANDATKIEVLPPQYGIPVHPGVSYGLNISIKTATTPLTPEPILMFFNKDGYPGSPLFIARTSSPEGINDTNWHDYKIEGQAPATATLLVPGVLFSVRPAAGPTFSPNIYICGVMVYVAGDVGTVLAVPPDRYLTVGDPSEKIGVAKAGFDPFLLGTPKSR